VHEVAAAFPFSGDTDHMLAFLRTS
jgi:hypothetical protein